MEQNKECSMQLYENAQHSELLNKFLDERLDFIKENKYPIILSTDPATRFIMYLIPVNFQQTFLDIKSFEEEENFLSL